MPDAFVARQPIFDPRLQVIGYELLFRGGGYLGDGSHADAERATATVVLNTLTELELKRIVGDKRAWINLSREFVLGGLAQAIPPRSVGLEIREGDLEADDMVEAVRELKRAGYRLALDDFRARPESDALLGLFDVVKLNLSDLGRQELGAQAARLKAAGATLVAVHVATRGDQEFCAEVGCDLFQGYFFCQPVVVAARKVSANRLALLQVVAALNDPGVEIDDVEALIARDVAISFRLLRYVNSAYFGLRGDVRSIGQALALLGLENVRRWATLSVMASFDDKPTELTVTALVRARFCELAGEALGIARPGELFTLGLFSVIDGMLDAPMQDVVESLPFATDMREALVYRHGELGALLDCIAALEVAAFGPAPSAVPQAGELYLEALIWANVAAGSLFGEPGAASGTQRSRDAGRSRRTPVVAPAHSKAPPGGDMAAVEAHRDPARGPADVRPAAPRSSGRGGWLRRVWARLRGG